MLWCALIAGLATAWFPASSRGQVIAEDNDIGRPLSAERVTRRFGFEEFDTNPTSLPLNWIRAQHDPPARVRPEFPIWNQAHLDDTVSSSGQGSVRLPTRGGSASLLLDPGVVPVFPDADYVVTAHVRTLGATHARARLAVRLLGPDGRAIAGSEVSSRPVDTRGLWRPLMVHVPGDSSEAVSLQIELLYEQPGPSGVLPYEDLEIVPQDFTGAAWFDDIAVVQVPRVELWNERPGNLVPYDERPEVRLFVRDLVGRALDIEFVASDIHGRPVDREHIVFEGGRLEHSWTPSLDRFGWYRVSVEVTQDGMRVGRAFTDLLWRAPGQVEGWSPLLSDASLSVGGVPTPGLGELGDLLLASGLGRVLTELWFEGAPADEERTEALSALANSLSPVNRELGVILPGLPAEVSEMRGVVGLLDAVSDASSDGAAWLGEHLIDLGHRVRWWRLGAIDEAFDGGSSPDFAAAVRRVRGVVPGAMLEVPWSPLNRLEAGLILPGLVVAQRLEPWVAMGEVGRVVDDFGTLAAGSGHSGWDLPRQVSVFRADDADRLGLDRAIDEMLLRVLHARAAIDGGDGAGRGRSYRLDGGWRWQGGRRAQLMPEPSAGAWLTLMEMLQGRVVERLGSVVPGVEGMLLVPGRNAPRGMASVVVLWAGETPERAVEARVLFSDGPVRVVDRFGNARVVESEPIGSTTAGAHGVGLGGVTYVVGADPELMRFVSRVRVEPALITTGLDSRPLELVIENPWESAISGKFFVVEPGGLSGGDPGARDRSWDISPRIGPFAIEPGSTIGIPITFEASAGVESGERSLMVDLEISTPTTSGRIRVERRVEVGLEHITMELFASHGPRGDVVVFAEVTNTGPETEVVHLYASAPGYARQRSAPTTLTPGQQVVKVFPFEGARGTLGGGEINVGLFIRETGGRLRRSVKVDER